MRWTLNLLGLGLLLSCGSPEPELRPGLWRASLDCRGHELRFGLEIARTRDGYTASILNGEEQLSVPTVLREGREFVFDIDLYDAGLRGVLSNDGSRLDGSWWRKFGSEATSRLPLHAEFTGNTSSPSRASGGGRRTSSAADDSLARGFSGRWAVKFAARSDSSVAVFRMQNDGTMAGTFMNTTGDYRNLSGDVEAGRLRLSRFDGAHVFLFEAALQSGRTIQGDFWEGDYFHDTWSGRLDPGARMSNPFAQMHWSGSLDLAKLVFPDLDGQMVSLEDPSVAGRAMLVDILGSWCPNCQDSSRYLEELYQRYRQDGLAVVGLAFEMTPDFERNSRQVRLFRERLGVHYPILLAAKSEVRRPSEVFPRIAGDFAIPTVLFLYGDGRVRAVHTGFSGPATGEDYTQLRREFEDIVRELLGDTRLGSNRGSN